MDKLTPDQRKECCMVFHTAISDENGTDLKAVHKAVCPEYDVVFTHDFIKAGSLDDEHMNYLYNIVDVYINLASNEGFGLGSCESLTTGTPIVVNVTGGLQDQCGFKNKNDEYLTADDYVELGSNHRGKYKEHGEWVVPVFPSNISLQGSPMTPYIFDDRCQYEEAGDALLSWYLRGPEERERCGEAGIKFVKDNNIGMDSAEMSNRFIESMDTAFKSWKPQPRYTMEVI
jgi:glycosyltransferase involved in cell wall biosynthesis